MLTEFETLPIMGPYSKWGLHDKIQQEKVKSALTSLRRQESALLRKLGERSLEFLSENNSVNDQDPKIRMLVEDIQKNRREQAHLKDRLNTLQLPPSVRNGFLPSPPGTDSRFPFSR